MKVMKNFLLQAKKVEKTFKDFLNSTLQILRQKHPPLVYTLLIGTFTLLGFLISSEIY